MGLRRELRKVLGYQEPEKLLNDSYAQEGEDMILDRIFEGKHGGFFIDVGAHHPIRFSNTYKFYRKDWRGINIDAMPGSMDIFAKIRPLDINLETPVSDKEETLPFYVFNEPALNTFSNEVAAERSKKPEYQVVNIFNITTKTLASILEEYLPENKRIDFLTIDAEGFDFQILQSNNWEKYKPSIVLIESDLPLAEMHRSPINQLMTNHGYEVFAKTVKTYFFKEKSFSVNL